MSENDMSFTFYPTQSNCKPLSVHILLIAGTSLHKLQIDGATVTEVLRLHLMSSGAKRLPSLVKSDIQQRGCYVSFDDPGLEFCRQNKRVLDSLKRKSVSELKPGQILCP